MGGWVIDVGGTLTVVDQRGDHVELRPKERSIVAAIALLHPDRAAVGTIAELVWPTPPPTAHKAVHNHVSRLRQRADGLIDTTADGYRLGGAVEIAPPSTDDVFRDLVEHPHVAIARTTFREQRLQAEEDRVATDLPRRPTAELIEQLVDFAEVEPHRPIRWRIAAVALARGGRRRAALDMIRRGRDIAAGDRAEQSLLQRIERAVLDDDPVLDVNDPFTRPAADIAGSVPTGTDAATSLAPTADHSLFVDVGGVEGRISEQLATGARGCVLLSGPAGAGKSTMCSRLRVIGPAHGWETHQVQARSHGSADADVVTALERSLIGRRPALDTRTAGEPLADRVVGLLAADGRRRLVIVDDAHHATRDEVMALHELALRTRDIGSVLWVVASRTDLDVGATQHLTVGSWSAADVEHLLHRFVPASRWSGEAAKWIAEQSEGNALTIRELVLDTVRRRSDTTGHDGGFVTVATPAAPTEWIRRRVEQLAPDERRALAGVAMIGLEFDRASLESFTAQAEAVIAAARLQGVIVLVDRERQRFRFTHDVLRDLLLDALDDATRGSLALVALRDPMFDDDRESRRRAALARIAVIDDPRRAISETIAAAKLEEQRHHPVEAERLYRRAFELIDRHDDLDDPIWLDASLRLGSVAISNGTDDALELLHAAADRAIDAKRPDHAALIVRELSRIGPASTVGRPHETMTQLVERARQLPTSDADEAHLIMAEMIIYGVGIDGGRARALLDEALALAERVGDRELIGLVEQAAYAATLRPGEVGFRRELAARIRAHGDELDDATLTYEGLRLEFAAAIEAGDLDPRPLMEQIEAFHRRFNERSRNWSLFAFRAAIAWLDGDAEGVQDSIDLLLSAETVVSPALKLSTAGGHLLGLHLLRGDLAALDPFVETLERDIPELRAWLGARAATAAAAGNTSIAAERLRQVCRIDDGQVAFDLPDDFTTLPTVFLLGEAAVSIGDDDSLSAAIDQLEPWTDQWLWHGTGTFGPVDLALARWKRAAGRSDSSVRSHALNALRSATVVGAPHVVAEAARLLVPETEETLEPEGADR